MFIFGPSACVSTSKGNFSVFERLARRFGPGEQRRRPPQPGAPFVGYVRRYRPVSMVNDRISGRIKAVQPEEHTRPVENDTMKVVDRLVTVAGQSAKTATGGGGVMDRPVGRGVKYYSSIL